MNGFEGQFITLKDTKPGIFAGTLQLYIVEQSLVPEGMRRLRMSYYKSNNVWVPRSSMQNPFLPQVSPQTTVTATYPRVSFDAHSERQEKCAIEQPKLIELKDIAC